jgi:transposase
MMGKNKSKKKVYRNKAKPQVREIRIEELSAIIERAKASLGEQDIEKLQAAVDTLGYLTRELEKKGVSIERLRKLIFGSSSEKTKDVFKDDKEDKSKSQDEGACGSCDTSADPTEPKRKRKGHGRNGASDYRGAEKVKLPHELLRSGEICPSCERGTLHEQNEPAVLVRVRGMAPLSATVYECERLRCNICGKVFTAAAPEGIGEQKYDETATSMVGMLKYGTGLPFNRLQRLQNSFGIPLPAGTQWQLVSDAADKMQPAYDELVKQAADGELLCNDDTTMKILELEAERGRQAKDGSHERQRTGVYTSAIVSSGSGHRIALFFTGKKHAGENLQSVLSKRAKQLSAPIQMCDMLSHNTSGDFHTIVAGCNAHARRRYVEVADSFPEQVLHVLEQLKIIYQNDAIAKTENMTKEQRLSLHQRHSGPVMDNLKQWLAQQIEQKKVEPNSSLGEAIGFMQKHWDKLTLFLRVPGAPLDNNIVERALKIAILHRKNALFYKTLNGARVGDMFMTFIHTAELNGVDGFDYLVALQRYYKEVALNPADWMPWNYQQTMARLGLGPAPPR